MSTLDVSIAASAMGKRSAAKLTPQERSQRASKAAHASWSRLTAPQRKDRAKRAAQNRKPSSAT